MHYLYGKVHLLAYKDQKPHEFKLAQKILTYSEREAYMKALG